MTLRALIADDEPVARRRLKRLLGGEPDVTLAGECGDGRSTIEQIEAARPDFVLLDVQMPDISGFDVVEALGRRMPAVIFVTAFDRYALKAFDVHAVDYLMKPVDESRFREAIARVRHGIQRGGTGDLAARVEAVLRDVRSAGRYLMQVPVPDGDRITLVPVSEIEWIEAADNYAALQAGGRKLLLRETMATLERSLDPRVFVRIHRSWLVPLAAIREIVPATHGSMAVVLASGVRLPLGRTYRQNLERAIGRGL